MIIIKKISNENLEKIQGGSVEWVGIGVAVAAIIIFLSGVFKGYIDPGKCDAA